MNYPIHEKELLTIIHALKIWHVYLEGQHFKIITDHRSLVYFNTQPTLSRRQARWNELLQEYDFEIIYKPRKTNVVADALSKIPDQQLNTVMQISPDEELLKSIKNNYTDDVDFGEIYRTLQDKKKTIPIHLRKRIQSFTLEDKCLIYNTGKQSCLCISQNSDIRLKLL